MGAGISSTGKSPIESLFPKGLYICQRCGKTVTTPDKAILGGGKQGLTYLHKCGGRLKLTKEQ